MVAACILIIAMLVLLILLILFVTISFNPALLEDGGGSEEIDFDLEERDDNDTEDVDIGSNDVGTDGGTIIQPVYSSKNTTIQITKY